MGILADIFVSTPDLAADYDASQLGGRDAHLKKFQPVEFKGFTPLEFGTLWALIAGEEWDVKKHMLERVSLGPDDESWLCRFQPEFVALLATMTDADMDRYAAAWAQTEELSTAGASNLRPVIVQLVRLSRDAQSSGREMYLWNSL